MLVTREMQKRTRGGSQAINAVRLKKKRLHNLHSSFPFRVSCLLIVLLFQYIVLDYIYIEINQVHLKSLIPANHGSARTRTTAPQQLLIQVEPMLPTANNTSSAFVTQKWFNPSHMTRHVCGEPIEPNGTLVVSRRQQNEDCWRNNGLGAPIQIFANTPTISGEGMPPIVVRFRDNYKRNKLEDVDCSVPCKVWPPGSRTIKNPADIDGTPFKFAIYSMEGPGYYPVLKVDPLAYQNDRYYATTSFHSDIPLPYYSEELYDIQHGFPPVNYDEAIKGASFLANNCNSLNHREKIVQELIDNPRIRIDSLSHCLQNIYTPPPGIKDLLNKTAVLRRYLFHLAFENQREDDYITEKLWGTLQSGTLPVYMGATNIKDHAPPNSIIAYDDFHSTEHLAKYLARVANNKTLYDTYHEWRKSPTLPESFQRKYNFTHIHSHCRMCRWSYAKRYGLGWDEDAQAVKDVARPRNTCIKIGDSTSNSVHHGLLSSPVLEEWWVSSSSSFKSIPVHQNYDRSPSCESPLTPENRRIKLSTPTGSVTWFRTVYDHDGITDILIEPDNHSSTVIKDKTTHAEEDVTLRFVTTLSDAKGLIRLDDTFKKYWLQNGISRIMFLFSEPVILSEPSDIGGIVDIPILLSRMSSSPVLRIRLIVEDVDTFHEGAEDRENFFGKYMADDFFIPLQLQT